MECCYESANEDQGINPGHKIVGHSPSPQCSKLSSLWFDLRVFYVRVNNCRVDGSTPVYLTLNHIPVNPDTLLEVNGGRGSLYSQGFSSLLVRNRINKKSNEATFMSTDCIRMSGTVKFEVYEGEDLLLSGVLEISDGNTFIGESKIRSRGWSMNCQSDMTMGSGFSKGKLNIGPEYPSPTIDVYVAGCFSSTPIILKKTLNLRFWRKHARKDLLDSIPECETTTTECMKDVPSELALQVLSENQQRLKSEYGGHKLESEQYYNNLYLNTEYIEAEDGELSWFNAGVRAGIGIGICLGVGLGIGLLVRKYQSMIGTSKRRLM